MGSLHIMAVLNLAKTENAGYLGPPSSESPFAKHSGIYQS
jgi:hypothetical protein